MVLDWAMAKIMVEEPTHASIMWHQTYMSTVVMASAASAIEQGGKEVPFIDTPFCNYKVHYGPPFSCVRVKGLVQSLPVHSCQVQMIAEPIASHRVTWGVMATNTYGTSVLAHSMWEWC